MQGITRHGQQPGINGAPAMTGPRIVANVDTDGPVKPSFLPLPGNDDNRGSEGVLARTMSYVAVSCLLDSVPTSVLAA